ncbi:hypothetical protein DJ010_12525 [Nocardioides silvaticus]|uniref:Uncharacterized protein n=1 Tax=Nocardioides silvaticus TaxID=2201891 RepID=A0A316TDU3_9ACTN|nr:hypothetical protein [Nocardioides silvaticus]PWN02547.1 hypothetical protein DJ010_12525 [Nocardioides silvaticus]
MTTDEPDEQLDPLSPAEEEQVRALLADARANGPMPADVVARLESSLAGLAAERVQLDPEPADNVVPIARTRRHRVVALLGAAAAAVVVGLGIGSFVDQGEDLDAGDSGAVSSDFDRRDTEAEDAGVAASEAAPEAEATPSEELARPDRPYVVRSDHLGVDLVRVQRLVLPSPVGAMYSHYAEYLPSGFRCKVAAWGKGVLVGVQYDGDPALVVFREPMGDAQVVEVLQCGTSDVLRSTTLPVPG